MDREACFGEHCWRIMGMELISVVFLLCFFRLLPVEPCACHYGLVYTMVFVHYAWMSGVYVLLYRK